MSDNHLRDLEKRWRETGLAVDGAALFAERLRISLLSREELDLAAFCGDSAARMVVGSDVDAALPDGPALLVGLGRFAPNVQLRAMVAAGEVLCDALDIDHPLRVRLQETLRRASLAVERPSKEHGAAAGRYAAEMQPLLIAATSADPNDAFLWAVHHILLVASRVAEGKGKGLDLLLSRARDGLASSLPGTPTGVIARLRTRLVVVALHGSLAHDSHTRTAD